ncbi:GH32 C-terminal domain-containing protein [Candidatus Ventrimonas sp. KK005]
MECKNESFVEMTQIPGNSYHVEMSLEGEGDFTILLAKDGDETLTLERKDGITGLVSQKEKAKEIRFLADVSRVEEIEIFVDRRVTEVFLNRGEAVGTKVFYQESKDGCFLAQIWEGTMKKVKISQMKSIWRKK